MDPVCIKEFYLFVLSDVKGPGVILHAYLQNRDNDIIRKSELN